MAREAAELFFAEYGPPGTVDADDDPSTSPLVIDFTGDLIEDIFRSKSKVTKIILAATWVEHWVNRVMWTEMDKQGYAEEDFVDAVRNSGRLAKKIAHWWPLLGLEPLNDDLLQRIGQVSEWRNAHVHYKWHDVEFSAHSVTSTEKVGIAVGVIWDLYRYEDRVYHKGRAAELYPWWPLDSEGAPVIGLG